MKIQDIDRGRVGHIDTKKIRPLLTDDLCRLIEQLERFGFQTRLVGGAVRDLIAGRNPRDIDLIADAMPDEIAYATRQAGFRPDAKGIEHGTILVNVDDGAFFEVTSLGYQIKEIDGRLQTISAKNWKDDSDRRDFTINAMSIDLQGNIYDYQGGLADLKNQYVRLIADNPNEVFRHSPVVMLRFFKMLTMFDDPKFDTNLLVAISEEAHLLETVSNKRVTLELENIHESKNADQIIDLMCKLGLDRYLKIACGDMVESRRAKFTSAQINKAIRAVSKNHYGAGDNSEAFAAALHEILGGDGFIAIDNSKGNVSHVFVKYGDDLFDATGLVDRRKFNDVWHGATLRSLPTLDHSKIGLLSPTLDPDKLRRDLKRELRLTKAKLSEKGPPWKNVNQREHFLDKIDKNDFLGWILQNIEPGKSREEIEPRLSEYEKYVYDYAEDRIPSAYTRPNGY